MFLGPFGINIPAPAPNRGSPGREGAGEDLIAVVLVLTEVASVEAARRRAPARAETRAPAPSDADARAGGGRREGARVRE